MMDWLLSNYQMLGAVVAAIFGTGTVIGSVRGRLKSLERRVEVISGRLDKVGDHLAVIKDRLVEITKNKEWYWRG